MFRASRGQGVTTRACEIARTDSAVCLSRRGRTCPLTSLRAEPIRTEGECAMARAVWTGQLIFGRVAIPVRLEGVVQDKGVKTHLVHREDHGRLHTKRFCEKGGHEVPWEDTARVVEVGNRQVVDFEP